MAETMKIGLLPVYSKLAEASSVPPELQARLPRGMRLSQHQVETYRALTEMLSEGDTVC